MEAEEHYYNAANTKLRDLGLQPHYLGDELVKSMLRTIEAYKGRVIERSIAPRTQLEALPEDEDRRARLGRCGRPRSSRPCS